MCYHLPALEVMRSGIRKLPCEIRSACDGCAAGEQHAPDAQKSQATIRSIPSYDHMSLLGESAPDFTLENTAGTEITLSDTLEGGPTVLVFFRAAWCSFCAEQLRTFSDVSYDLWYNHDTDILPISADSVGNLVEMRDRYDLRIQLLSDPDFSVTTTYTERVEHDWRDDYTRSGTFVVDSNGTVRYEQIAEAAADRTYGNFVRYFIKRDFSDRYGTTSGEAV